jgi:hypothetical protein
VHAAADVDQPVGTVDLDGQQVGREDVDGERARVSLRGGDPLGVDVDAGVVDDGVHPADRVDLVGETVRLAGACEVADYNRGCPVSESADADGP